MTAVRRLPERRVRPGQRPGSSLSPVASTAHTVGAAKPNLCRAAPRGRCPVAPPRPEPTRAVPAAPRRPGPGAAALLVRGRFSRRGLRLGVLRGVRLRLRLLVAAVVVLGKLGHLGQHRTWRGAGGRRDRGGPSRSGRGEPLARLARLLLRHLHGLAAALGDGQPAREQAKTDQRSPPRPARCVAALLTSLPGHHVHLPPPPLLIGLLCCLPHFGTSGTSGASRQAGPRPDSTLLPDLPSLCAATRTSAITRTDLTDLRLSLQASTWRVPVGGCRLGVRSGGPLWCRLGAGVGQRDRWVWQRYGCAGPAGRGVVAGAGLVGGAAEPVADGRAGPGRCPGRRPHCAVLGGGIG